jgi:hypothetical protein
MSSSSDGVRFTVHDGAVWMDLDNLPVHIPPNLVNRSHLLKDALSSVDDSSVSREFTLTAPKKWLEAWLACYSSGEERLRHADTEDLVHCLLVSFKSLSSALARLKPA